MDSSVRSSTNPPKKPQGISGTNSVCATDIDVQVDSESPTTAWQGDKASGPGFAIRPARMPDELHAAASLFRSYAAWLNIDLSFQSFETELASLPGKYAHEKGGRILLAYLSGIREEPREPIGCIALRDITDAVAEYYETQSTVDKPALQISHRRISELKRLYVLPEGRSFGLGRALVKEALAVAKELGYSEVLLDTLPCLEGAQKLYRRLGFVETRKYHDTNLEGTIFMSYRFD